MQTNMSGAVGAPANVGKTATTSASATDSKAVTKRSVCTSRLFSFLSPSLLPPSFPFAVWTPFQNADQWVARTRMPNRLQNELQALIVCFSLCFTTSADPFRAFCALLFPCSCIDALTDPMLADG